MPKNKKSILDKTYHAQIIYDLAFENKSIPNVARRLNKGNNTIWTQMKALEDIDLVKKSKKYKTHYVLNCRKIVDLFEQRIIDSNLSSFDKAKSFYKKNNDDAFLLDIERVLEKNKLLCSATKPGDLFYDIVQGMFIALMRKFKDHSLTINEFFDAVNKFFLYAKIKDDHYLNLYQRYVLALNFNFETYLIGKEVIYEKKQKE